MTSSVSSSIAAPLREMCATKVYVLLISFVVYLLGVAVLSPFKVTLLTDYFAGTHAGGRISCTDLPVGVKPPEACQSAHNDVVAWSTVKSFVGNIFLTSFLTPMICRWSDFYGRKPFLLYGMGVQVLSVGVVLLHLKFDFPLWWYYPAAIIESSFSAFTVSYAYIADVASPENRTFLFGLVGSSFGLAFLIGPMFIVAGYITDPLTSAWLSFGGTLMSFIVLLFLPESLSKETMISARNSAKLDKTGGGWRWSGVMGPFRAWWSSVRILFRTNYFVKLTLCVVIMYMLFEEVMDIEFQYLQEVAGFGTHDQAIVFTLMGGLSLFISTVVLWALTAGMKLSNKQILLLGITTYAGKLLLLTFCKSKVQAYIAIALGSFVGVIFPAVGSIKSQYVSREEQGAVQGALGTARSLSTGIGPLFFLALFVGFRQGGLYFPGAPFLVSFFFIIVAFMIALSMKLPQMPSESKACDLEGNSDAMEPLIERRV